MSLNVEWAGDLPAPLRIVVMWGIQTLCYALSKRTAVAGMEMAPGELEKTLGQEAVKTITEMWERALAEADTKDPYNADELVTRMARQIVDWTVDNARG